jgi:hypothetical protein
MSVPFHEIGSARNRRIQAGVVESLGEADYLLTHDLQDGIELDNVGFVNTVAHPAASL